MNVAFDVILKTLNNDNTDIFMHTKTKPCWIDPNLCAPQRTCQGWKRFSTKKASSSRVVEKSGIQRFLQTYELNSICCFTGRCTMVSKDAVPPKPLLKNHTFNICLLCFCSRAFKWTTGRRNFKHFLLVLEKNGWNQPQSVPESPHELYSSCWGFNDSQ